VGFFPFARWNVTDFDSADRFVSELSSAVRMECVFYLFESWHSVADVE
jgi:hypothetical protein